MRQRQPELPGGDQRRQMAERVYALLLLMYPPAHRRDYGPLMLQAFRDNYRDVLATQGRAGPRFWLDVAGDEVRSLAREHAAALRASALHIKRWGIDIAAGGALLASAVVYIARCIHT